MNFCIFIKRAPHGFGCSKRKNRTVPSVQERQDLGVARLSMGSGLMKATLALIKKIAGELAEKGTYNILSDTLTPLSNAAMAYKMATGQHK